MSTSRPESHSGLGRKRSNTVQSSISSLRLTPAVPSLSIGDATVLNAWVHDPTKESSNVLLTHAQWPGVAEGDMIMVVPATNSSDANGFLFVAGRDDKVQSSIPHISIPRPLADRFGVQNNGKVTLTKVDKLVHAAEYVEISFQDQYLGRCDMWRLGKHLNGQCVHVDQEVTFIGSVAAKILNIFIRGRKVSAAHVTPYTKAIYRSLSAKITIFIQVCHELWEFANDGERYNEKIVHSFLPELFAKWREAGTNHIVTIVLISRVYYDQSEIDYAAGPLRQDEDGNWYKDFFKVVTDLEIIDEWKPTLVSLKDYFWAFQRDILLTHHYHRAALVSSPDAAMGALDQVRLVGRLSFAHDGPILEALNLSLNPTETHYIDRSLTLTGISTILITPGTGHFRVNKQLLRLTTTRMLDQGFGLDLISLAKRPLHQSPVFSFQGVEPELRSEREEKGGGRKLDPLWGGEDDPAELGGQEKTTFWWEPFWVAISFWDGQTDLPFRQDRFIARAKMHEIQMLGLLSHDVLSSIEVPYLDSLTGAARFKWRNDEHRNESLRHEAEQFDSAVFELKKTTALPSLPRGSLASSSSGTAVMSSSVRSYDKRSSLPPRNSNPGIGTIEESPRPYVMDLPDSESQPPSFSASASTTSGVTDTLSTSPAAVSVLSRRSSSTVSSTNTTKRKTASEDSHISRPSRFTPSWFLNAFRSPTSQAQMTSVTVSGTNANSQSPTTQAAASAAVPTAPPPRPREPVPIKNTPSRQSIHRSTVDDDMLYSTRSSVTRHSPVNTPPRDDHTFGKRRSGTISSLGQPVTASSPPRPQTNPSRPVASVPDNQASLARRWQHMFAEPLYQHHIKWKSIVTPGCLPLTTEYLPSQDELDNWYDLNQYELLVDPPEMRSFLVRPPPPSAVQSSAEVRKAWALTVIRGMAGLRLAQGFQIVVRPDRQNSLLPVTSTQKSRARSSRLKPFATEPDLSPKAKGASDVLNNLDDPVWLSMSNEIHCISYTGETIQVRRYARRMPTTKPIEYHCLIWPKLGVGYTELKTTFTSHGMENYTWNRMDFLVAGYAHDFSESLRYWRTRFVVIPTAEPPPSNVFTEKLDDEEVRLMGIDKLAELFMKARWVHPAEASVSQATIPRFLPTSLGPAASVLDENLIARLEEIHAAGPARKKVKSERDIDGLSLVNVAKAMREEDGVPIKDHRWHSTTYKDSFTGWDLASWLLREFRDVSTREQAVEWGVKLMTQGLFEHCREAHGFLDGHYFYRLKGDYAAPPRTPTARRWFPSMRNVSNEDKTPSSEYPPKSGFYPGTTARPHAHSPRRNKKRLVLSQTMVIDVDTNKRSDQAETALLHYDIIHNPATVFHFELNWIGTTGRCIEDTLKQWSARIERYGLKLVEAYVTEISDIRERNPFQSCFPLRPVIPAPIVPDLHKRVPEGAQATHYFEYAMLEKFGFILDIEASNLYSDQVEVFYSYRRSAFKYSQFIHRSGVAFVQVLPGQQGFLFLTNRLMAPGRMGASLTSKEPRKAKVAEELRSRLTMFCSSPTALNIFYDEVLARLPIASVPEDPPPLSI